MTAGCGSSSDVLSPTILSQSPPLLKAVDPVTAGPGDQVTLYGIGFSAAAPENVVILGDATATADSYAINDPVTHDSSEKLIFTVPANAPTGEQTISLLIFGEISNANFTITITP